ncbi:transcriptional regulator [Rugamonas sp. FT82W]|uniref:Transcriptional regulator n=1 Tax=Duganella vulcania TaxID=2692166 RepID=A0A845G3V0_9BURK|nr:transcriptional regulator [Duganella vulcania]
MVVPQTRRSGCPINLTLEQIGDRWSLIVIRDVMFANRRSYGALLEQNEEGIASNILASRLKHLTASGLLTRSPDPTHQQKGIYSLTEAAIQLVPLLAHMAAWGVRHTHPSKEASVPAILLEKGGPSLWGAFMDDLRHLHLGAPRPARSAFDQLRTEDGKAITSWY